MKCGSRILLGWLALALSSTLYAATLCTTGGAPVQRDGSGQGGTGLRPVDGDGSGQGGTGWVPGSDGSGSGGTGLTVEVDGVITGFASICVNGLELHYAPTTPVTLLGQSATPKELAVGQVVRALARGQGDQLAVQRVQVRHLLVATIQGINPGELRAQGRTISLSPDAMLPAGLAPGIKVAVSGFVGAHGLSVVTRLDAVPGNTPDSLTGEVKRNAQGELSVDGVTLEGRLPKLEPGDTVRAEGHYAQGRMQITHIEREERTLPVDRVVIQGSIRHADKSGLSIGNQHFLIDAGTRIKQVPPRAGEWAIIDAVREGRQLHVREVEVQSRPGVDLDRRSQREEGAGHDGKTSAPEQEHRSKTTEVEHQNRAAEHSDRIESPERTEKSESPEKIERIEKSERPETAERPEKIELPERVERTETVERPERVERTEKIERPEKIELPERVERPEPPEHGD